MVVPDRVVQAERLVAIAPAVTGPRILLQHDGRHGEPRQARGQGDAALATTNDDAVGLARGPELGLLRQPELEPALAVGMHAMGDTVLAPTAGLFFVPLEGAGGGEQGPTFAVSEPYVTPALAIAGFKTEPRLGAVSDLARLALDLEMAWAHAGQRRLEAGRDLRHAVHGRDVPGEGDHIAPQGLLVEQAGGRGDVARCQPTLEGVKPMADFAGWGVIVHG